MTLAYPDKPGGAWIWGAAALASVALHVGLPMGIMAPAATPPPEPRQETGVTGAIMFDLSDIIAAPADSGQDSAAQTVTESAEVVDPAKAADEPVLNQIPHAVEDDELKFGVASPDPVEETEELAQETATEFEPEKVDEASTLGAEDADASVASVSGQDAPAEAETAQAKSEGLSADQKAEVQAWQKNVVLAIAKAKSYPAKARAKRIEGTVKIRFSLDGYGTLLSREVAESSGYPLLDQAALAVFDKIAKFPTPPSHLNEDRFTLMVPINYSVK